MLALLFVAQAQSSTMAGPVAYTDNTGLKAELIIDVRQLDKCEKASLPGAHCLPLRDVLGPHKRLANISGLLWLLGTVGLSGFEHVMVIGDRARDRDFMAGLLYIAGQKKTTILETVISNNSALANRLEAGTVRGRTREKVFQASMRSQLVVLRSELLGMIRSSAPPVILDGRSEQEYWGAVVRAARGGHIPGAQLAPSSGRLDRDEGDDMPVLYGHDAYEGLAMLARSLARGYPARLYLEGWAGWASDGALPADAVTYATRSPGKVFTTGRQTAGNSKLFSNSALALWVTAIACMGAGTFLGYRLKANRGA